MGKTLGTVSDTTATAGDAVTWTRRITGFGSVWNCWRKYVATTVAGLTYAEFKQLVACYNPTLAASAGQFTAQGVYFLPENPYPLPIVWDRPLTDFGGSLWACWQHHVENKVIGLSYAAFKKAVVIHNPNLQAEGRRFLTTKRYVLPRTADQTDYAVATVTDNKGRFRFTICRPVSIRLKSVPLAIGPLLRAFLLHALVGRAGYPATGGAGGNTCAWR